MNNELSKLFGRNYVVSFFLPAFFFLAGSCLSLRNVGISSPLLHVDVTNVFEGSALLAVETFILGVFLQSINRELFRFAEGYWFGWFKAKFYDPGENWAKNMFDGNPKNMVTDLDESLHERQRLEFKELTGEIKRLEEAGRALKKGETFSEQEKLNRLSLKAARRFPSTKEQVLPTSFGNVVKAYEDYSRVVYKVESIYTWARLQMLMSKDMREVLDSARSRLDMWLNLIYVWAALAVLNGFLCYKFKSSLAILCAIIALAFSWLSYRRATNGAEQFGDCVKGVFDLLLPKLCRKLGYNPSSDPQKNRAFWEGFNQVVIYRDKLGILDMKEAGLEPVAEEENDEKKPDSGPWTG